MAASSSVHDLRITLSISSEHILKTHPEYRHTTRSEVLTTAKFHEVTDLLLEKPNLNSSHLFRADILWDSAGILKTKAQHEASLNGALTENGHDDAPPRGIDGTLRHRQAPPLNGKTPYRTVVRRLIPRNQNLDKPLEQSCYLYELDTNAEAVVYLPHVESAEDMPWYHPRVMALAYVFEPSTATNTNEAALSLWHLPFNDTMEVPQRLHRTLLALGSTFLRLARYQAPSTGSAPTPTGDATIPAAPATNGDLDLRPSALKDTILPQHVVQDTYARLKTTYGPSLIASWVEATPPEKHVFEDLSIAAFLVCLWRKMYDSPEHFGGFVDLACGNGLLVYILNQEGWTGWGIDARRRKTWAALGMEDGGLVKEGLIVPKPFMSALLDVDADADDIGNAAEDSNILQDPGVSVHDGLFEPRTFIISNHADELTLWTPLLAALSCPEDPLPFLAIPCCSHALSGEKHRYSPKDASLSRSGGKPAESVGMPVDRPMATEVAPSVDTSSSTSALGKDAQTGMDYKYSDLNAENTDSSPRQPQPSQAPPPLQPPQPAAAAKHQPLQKQQLPEQGSLLALRAAHQQERDRTGTNGIANGSGSGSGIGSGSGSGSGGEDKSAYGCLTRKTVQVARRVGVDVTCTLMRIPSTRNVGIVAFAAGGGGGGCEGGEGAEGVEMPSGGHWREGVVRRVVWEECVRRGAGSGGEGGVRRSAEVWVERARKVHVGHGRGKVNWGGKRDVGRG